MIKIELYFYFSLLFVKNLYYKIYKQSNESIGVSQWQTWVLQLVDYLIFIWTLLQWSISLMAKLKKKREGQSQKKSIRLPRIIQVLSLKPQASVVIRILFEKVILLLTIFHQSWRIAVRILLRRKVKRQLLEGIKRRNHSKSIIIMKALYITKKRKLNRN